MRLDLTECATGVTKQVTVDTAILCDKCQGKGTNGDSTPVACDTCGGRGEIQTVQRSLLGQVMTSRPCPVCGYRYGTAWLVEPLPVTVEEDARQLASLPQAIVLLAPGLRIASANPAAERMTRGKAVKIDFGATVQMLGVSTKDIDGIDETYHSAVAALGGRTLSTPAHPVRAAA